MITVYSRREKINRPVPCCIVYSVCSVTSWTVLTVDLTVGLGLQSAFCMFPFAVICAVCFCRVEANFFSTKPRTSDLRSVLFCIEWDKTFNSVLPANLVQHRKFITLSIYNALCRSQHEDNLRENRLFFDTPLSLLVTVEHYNNNNDRLMAFDPGQPG